MTVFWVDAPFAGFLRRTYGQQDKQGHPVTHDQEAAQDSRPRRAASQEYPKDRFDSPKTGRVGAHRVTAQPRVTWQFVVGGLVCAALLTTIGIVGATLYNASGKATPTHSQTQKVEAKPDPEARVVLLDGTTETGDIAQRLATSVADGEWGVVVLAAPASSTDVERSAVFYSDPADEAAALALAKQLGGIGSFKSDDYADYDAQLVVLIGSDYTGPGRDAG